MTRKRQPDPVPTPLVGPEKALKRFCCLGQTVGVSHDTVPREKNGGEALGTCSWNPEILIHPAATGARRQEVECHEVVEMLNAELGLELDHGKIQALGSALQQFLATAVYEDIDE